MAQAPHPTTLHIKNMVCDRCIRTVQQRLAQCGLVVLAAQLGQVVVSGYAATDAAQQQCIAQGLASEGFALLTAPKAQLVSAIQGHILHLVRSTLLQNNQLRLSDYLEQQTGKPYHQLATAFAESQPISIERYFILQRIELAKELLAYGELPIKEIAYQLGYSSVAYLSNQFKQVTGYTPATFRDLKGHHRHGLDQLGHLH